MKKALSLILIVCMIFSSLSLNAAAEEPEDVSIVHFISDGIIILRKADGMIVAARGLTGEVIVPQTIEGITVRGIEAAAGVSPFEESPYMTMLTLPGSIETLVSNAITSQNLFSLTLSNGTKTIEQGAINADELTSLTFPDSLSSIKGNFLTSDKAKIYISGNNPYFSMDGQGLIYNKQMNEIVAFAGERALHANLTLPSGVKIIRGGAFASTKASNTLKTITFNGDLEEIGDGAFMGSSGLREIDLPASLKKIGTYAFANCQSFESIMIPDATELSGYAFAECRKLTSVSLGEAVTVIPEGTFSGTGLMNIPNLSVLTEIGANAFVRCPLGVNIDFPASLARIGSGAFAGCKMLESVSFGGEIEIGEAAFEETGIKGTLTLDYKIRFTGTRQFAGCPISSLVVRSGVFSLPTAMLEGCMKLYEVTIPPSVTSMNNFLGNLPMVNRGITMRAEQGSAAHIYANEQKLRFIATGAVEMNFIDIGTHWAKEDILWANRAGLFGGVSSVLFSPNTSMLREMFAAVLYRTTGDAIPTELSGFADVADNVYFTRAASWAKSAGIIQGIEPTLFGTGMPIRRQDIVTMLYRYAEYIGEDMSNSAPIDGFADASDVSGYAIAPMMWAVASGIIAGDELGNLNPFGLATRAEVAAILHRFFEGPPETDPEQEIPEEPGEENPEDTIPEEPPEDVSEPPEEDTIK